MSQALQPGFVDAYFTPQIGPGVYGHENHLAASFAWHPAFADVRLDLTDVTLSRNASAAFPSESVAMNYPSALISFARQVNAKTFWTAGAGRFAVDGSFDTVGAKNADLVQNMIFGGFQFKSNASSSYQVMYRLYSVHGLPTTPLGPDPAYHGPQLTLERIFRT